MTEIKIENIVYKLNTNKLSAIIVSFDNDAKSIFISVSPVFEFNEDREDYLELQGFSYYISYYPNGILDLTDIGDCNVYPTREDALENGILCVLKSTLI